MSGKLEPIKPAPFVETTRVLMSVSSEFMKRHITVRNVCIAAMLATVTFCPQARIFLAATLQISSTLAAVLGNLIILMSNLMVSGLQGGGSFLSGLKSLLGSGSENVQKKEEKQEEVIVKKEEEKKSVNSWANDFAKGEQKDIEPAQKMIKDFVEQQAEIPNLVEDFVAAEKKQEQQHIVAPKPQTESMQDLGVIWDEKRTGAARFDKELQEAVSDPKSRLHVLKLTKEEGFELAWKAIQGDSNGEQLSEEEMKAIYEKVLSDQFSKLEETVNSFKNIQSAITSGKVNIQQLGKKGIAYLRVKGAEAATAAAEMKAPAFKHLLHLANL